LSEVQTAKRPTPASWRADGIWNETNTALSIRGVVFSRRLEHLTGIFAAVCSRADTGRAGGIAGMDRSDTVFFVKPSSKNNDPLAVLALECIPAQGVPISCNIKEVTLYNSAER
jgi:hypothetical protein